VAEAVGLRRRIVTGRRAVGGAAVAELRSRISALPALPAAASDAEATWLAYRRRFRRDVLTRDPRRFLRWPVLRPMYKRDAPYLGSWLAYLRAHRDWPSRWRPAIRESAVGDPRPYVDDRWTSGNLLKQAYHACRFEDVTGARLSDVDVVLEFGAGYGAFCRLAFALGFRGTYAMYDFPEFSALQAFYVRAHGLPIAEGSRPPARGAPRILTLSSLGELDELLADGLPGRAAFVALWSLSEAPWPFRDAVAARLTGFDAFVIGYQPRFGEIDNTEWFRGFRDRLAEGVEWHDLPLEEHHESMRHLFGARRGRRGVAT
jgi:hypothetical protein